MRKHVVWFFLLATSFAQGQASWYSNAEFHYALLLPENWTELPPDQIRNANEALRKGLPQLRNLPTYDAWFQLRNRPDCAYPYIVLNHKRCDPPTLADIRAAYLKQKAEIEKKLNKNLEGFSRDTIFGEPVIDTHLNAVLIPLEQTVLLGEIGPIQGEMAFFPGREGIAQLNFYARKDEIDAFRPAWKEILDSFHYEERYGYEDAFRPHGPREIDYSRMVVGGIFGGIASIFLTRFFRSRGESPGMVRLQVIFSLILMMGFLFGGEESGPLTLAFQVISIVVGLTGLIVITMRKLMSPPPQ